MTKQLKVKKQLPEAILPSYATSGSSGFDLFTYKDIIMFPETRWLVDTGLIFDLDQGTEMQIRSKSGNALNKGLIVLNQPATIDSDYKKSVGVILFNTSKDVITIEAGKAIAQGVICPVIVPEEIIEVNEVSDSSTRDGGFGSTNRGV